MRPALDDMLGLRPRPASEERLLLPRDLSRLRDLLEGTGARLLIIDPLVAWLDERPLDADGLNVARPAPEETQAVAEAMAFLQDYLRDCAVPANCVIREARLTGISEKTLRRAKYKLGVISRIWPYSAGGGDRWAWELPQAAPAPPAPG